MELSEEYQNLNEETKEFIKELATYIDKRRNRMSYRYLSMRLSSFADVAKRYNEVKPMVSKNHKKEDDLRPIGVRSRKHERIIKVNDQKYILNDGEVDPIGFWGSYHHSQAKRKPTMQEVEALAPIVWSIDDEGNEFIKIRNGSGGGAHMSRYTFLEHNLPIDMDFLVDNGKQYICMGRRRVKNPNTGHYEPDTIIKYDVQHFLPKSDYVWWVKDSEEDRRQLFFCKPVNTKEWLPEGNTFQFAPPKWRVDKKRKAELKGAIESMWNYINAMWNLVDIGDRYDWQTHQRNRETMTEHYNEWLGEDSKDMNHWWDWTGKGDFIAHVFQTEDHPCRVTLLDMFVRDSILESVKRGDYKDRNGQDYESWEIETKVRSQYNNWINKALELKQQYTEATIVELVTPRRT